MRKENKDMMDHPSFMLGYLDDYFNAEEYLSSDKDARLKKFLEDLIKLDAYHDGLLSIMIENYNNKYTRG